MKGQAKTPDIFKRTCAAVELSLDGEHRRIDEGIAAARASGIASDAYSIDDIRTLVRSCTVLSMVAAKLLIGAEALDAANVLAAMQTTKSVANGLAISKGLVTP